MNISCVEENTVTVTPFYCSCFRGFYGNRCENRIMWYSPIMVTVHVIQSLFLLSCFVWSLLTIHYNSKRGRLGLNLSSVALILHVISTVIRLVYLWIPSRSVLLLPQSALITNVSIVLVYTYIALEMIICIICVSFWYDALSKIEKVQITSRTRWFVGVGSSSFLIGSIIGMILIIMGNVLGSILVLVPMLGNIIGIFATLMLLSKIDVTVFTKGNLERRNWAISSNISALVFWFLYFLSMLSIPIFNMLNLVYWQILPDLLFRVCEIGILLSINVLLDFKFKSILRLTNLDVSTSVVSSEASK
jgi:hypothetical protein